MTVYWLAATLLLVLANTMIFGYESQGAHISRIVRMFYRPLDSQIYSMDSRSVKLLLTFASKAIPGFSLLEIHEQDFSYLLDTYMFRNGASYSTKVKVGLSAEVQL
jgi:hypothetical protein